jgi:hypothetical protein
VPVGVAVRVLVGVLVAGAVALGRVVAVAVGVAVLVGVGTVQLPSRAQRDVAAFGVQPAVHVFRNVCSAW